MDQCLHGTFPGGSDSKASVYNVKDLGSIPGLGRFPGEGNGNRLQYSCLENPMAEELGAGYYPWGRKESGTTERLHFTSLYSILITSLFPLSFPMLKTTLLLLPLLLLFFFFDSLGLLCSVWASLAVVRGFSCPEVFGILLP